MKIEKRLISQNFTRGRTKPIQYVVIHDTANTRAGADALSHYRYFDSADRQASAHYFVDDRRIVQTVEDTDTAWHGGRSVTEVSNDNSIGIEICVNSDGDYRRAVEKTAELAAFLLKKYALSIDRLKRHYDISRKICPRSMYAENWESWGIFVSRVSEKLVSGDSTASKNPELAGKSQIRAVTLAKYLLSKNPAPKLSCTALELADIFIAEGEKEGIRGDLAFCQALHETGNFRFGGDVKPEQNNFAGLGATGGVRGNSFSTPQEGVRAQIQHLKAYANAEPLSQPCVDVRFALVARGSAPRLLDLAGKWAYPGYPRARYKSLQDALNAGETYGHAILRIYEEVEKMEEKKMPAPAVHAWKTEAREFVMQKGISDGSRPTDAATREEVWAMMKNLYSALNRGVS
ncbi:MAG: N-acetylmuramoyl-L-alanine amidase [Peptostreptococcaceae bacterium]|nr:N-acetylmuramoyl-L-alanine amidase [Peptostreptococcaceae bacterium]